MPQKDAQSSHLKLYIEYIGNAFYGTIYHRFIAITPSLLSEGHILESFFKEGALTHELIPIDDMYRLYGLYQNGSLATASVDVRFSFADGKSTFSSQAPVVQFRYDEETGALKRELPLGCKMLAGRFFLFDGNVSCIPDIGANSLVEKSSLEGEDIIKAAKSGLHPNISSQVKVSGQPASTLSMRKLKNGSIEIFEKELCPANRLKPLKGLNNLCFDGEAIRRVMSDRLRGNIFGGMAQLSLSNAAIPKFAESFEKAISRYGDNALKSYFQGILLQRADLKLFLTFEREEAKGVGRVWANPTVSAGREKSSLKDIYETEDGGFAQIGSKWAKTSDLKLIGAVEGMEYEYSVHPDELIMRGGPRLDGPWEGFDAPVAEWRSHAPWSGIAEKHYDFLRAYGINGAVYGIENDFQMEMVYSYASSLRSSQNAKVLIIVPRGAVFAKDRPDIAYYDELDTLIGKKADIVFFLNLGSPGIAKYFDQAQGLKTRLRLGAMSSAYFDMTADEMESIADLLEIDASLRGQPFIRYAIRGKNETLSLPPQYRGGQLPAGQMAERAISNFQAALQIKKLEHNSLRFEDSPKVSTDAQFLRQARQYESRVSSKCEAAPFGAYWPTYQSMGEKQLDWHFYWRSKARLGDYLYTPMAYILLYAYETINGIGWNSPSEGLRILTSLWKAYRVPYPALDRSLPCWIMDFAIINDLKSEAEDTLKDAPGEYYGILFSLRCENKYINGSEPISTEDMARLSSYNPARSSFAAKYGLEKLMSAMNMAVNSIDSKMRIEYKQGLVSAFMPQSKKIEHRSAFRNAVYAGSIRYMIEYFDFAAADSLSQFIGGAMKITENELRGKSGAARLLKPPKMPGGWDQYVKSLFEKPGIQKGTAGSSVEVKIGDLSQLRIDSEYLKNKLLSEDEKPLAGEGGELVFAVEESLEGSSIDDIFSQLTDAQNRALKAILSNEGMGAVDKIALECDLMADELIDSINEAFNGFLGDIAIEFSESGPKIVEEFRSGLEKHFFKEH